MRKLNYISIIEPRWHDRVVLVAERKLGQHNQITIQHKDFPQPFYLSGEQAKKYPIEQLRTRSGYDMPVRAIPLAELEKEVINI